MGGASDFYARYPQNLSRDKQCIFMNNNGVYEYFADVAGLICR
jgi:hypothetical protein